MTSNLRPLGSHSRMVPLITTSLYQPQLSRVHIETQIKCYSHSQRVEYRILNRVWHSNDGSVVEFSPATREARVRFPVVATIFSSNFTNPTVRSWHQRLNRDSTTLLHSAKQRRTQLVQAVMNGTFAQLESRKNQDEDWYLVHHSCLWEQNLWEQKCFTLKNEWNDLKSWPLYTRGGDSWEGTSDKGAWLTFKD